MKYQKKNKYLLIGIIFVFMIITLGVSLALFRFAENGQKENIIQIGEMTFRYIENKGNGNGIQITDATPIPDSEGKIQEGEGKVFDFQVEAELSRSDIEYEIVAKQDEEGTLPLEILKFYMTDITNGGEKEIENCLQPNGEVKTLSEYQETQIVEKEGKTIYQETIEKNTAHYRKEFRVRMWVKDGADLTEVTGTTGSIRVDVYANSNREMASTDTTSPEDVRIERVTLNEIYTFQKVEEQSYQYDITVEKPIDMADITVVPTNIKATTKIEAMKKEGMGLSESFPLEIGENFFKVTVTSSDGSKSQDYVLRVVREKSKELGLNGIEVDGYELNPKYSDEIDLYRVEVPYEKENITVRIDKKEAEQIVTEEKSYPLIVGPNPITVTVTSENGETRTIQIIVERLKSNDAGIENVGIEGYDYHYVSDNVYEVEVKSDVETITIKNVSTTGATVNGIGEKPLEYGPNEFEVTVISQSGLVTRQYIIRVIRKISSNSNLKRLEVVGEELEPGFESGITEYQVEVENEITSVEVIAEPEDEKSQVTITGGEDLQVGTNEITITVEAEDKTKTIYTITVRRKPSSDATLASLEVEGKQLDQEFRKDFYEYTLTVPYDVASIMVKGVATKKESHVEGVGNQPLRVGPNPITITVTAEDQETVLTYHILVTRLRDTDNSAKRIYVVGYEEEMEQVDEKHYTLTVGNEVKTVDIQAEANSVEAIVSGTGPQELAVGDNKFYITITSQSEEAAIYEVKIHRNASSDATLKRLEVEGYEIKPNFERGHLTYTVDTDDIEINVIAEVNNEEATITKGEGKTTITWGVQTITVTVVAGDKETTNDYVITVNNQRPTAPTIRGGSSEWKTTSQKIEVIGEAKSVSGIEKYQYYISNSNMSQTGGTWTDCEEEKGQTITENGTHYIYFRGVSVKGIEGEVSEPQTIKIDAAVPEAPTVTGGGTNLTSSRTFTITAPSSISGIKSYEYYITDVNSEPKQEQSATGSVTSDGEKTEITINAKTGNYIYFRAINQANTVGKWTKVQNLYVNTALLSSLSVTSYNIDPGFSAVVDSYTVSVPYSVEDVTVTAVAATQGATVKIEGGTGLKVDPEKNTITITVTGPDSTIKTYTIAVTRQKDTNNNLSGLTVTGLAKNKVYTLTPEFAAGTQTYTVTTEETTIRIGATAASAVAVVSGKGDFQPGWTTSAAPKVYTISVAAQNGETKTYTIRVINQRPTAPTITGGNSNSWFTSAPTISVVSTSPGTAVSGIASYDYIIQTSNAAPAETATRTGNVASGVKVNDVGTHYVFFRTVSNNGNTSPWSSPQVVKLETSNPSVPGITGGSSSWSQSAKTISVSTVSSATSGIKNYQYCESDTNNASNCKWTDLTSEKTSVSISTNGTRYIFFRAVSNAGRISAVSTSQTTMVDTTTPTAPVLTGGSTYWSNTTLTISVQTDSISPSGIKNYQYYISINSTTPTGGSWTDCSTSKTSQTITTEGIRYIFFRAVNNVGTTGNLSAYQTTMIDTKNTTLDGYEIKNVTKTGYDIYFYGLRTPNGISKIQIPTWTIYNGQDDLPTGWKNNNLFTATYIDNNTYSYHVNIENHNNEAGKYRSHVYILDKNNKWFNPKQIDYILETTNYVGSLYLDNSKSVFNKDGYYRIKETTLYSNFTYDFNAQPNAITAISQLGSYHLDTSNNNTLLHDLMSTETNTAGIGLNIGINGAVAIAHTGNYYYTLLSYEGDLTASHWYRFTVKNNIPSLYIDGKLAATGIQPVNGSQLDNRFNPPAYTVTKLVSLTAIGGGSYGKYSGTANNFVVYNTAK